MRRLTNVLTFIKVMLGLLAPCIIATDAIIALIVAGNDGIRLAIVTMAIHAIIILVGYIIAKWAVKHW